MQKIEFHIQLFINLNNQILTYYPIGSNKKSPAYLLEMEIYAF